MQNDSKVFITTEAQKPRAMQIDVFILKSTDEYRLSKVSASLAVGTAAHCAEY